MIHMSFDSNVFDKGLCDKPIKRFDSLTDDITILECPKCEELLGVKRLSNNYAGVTVGVADESRTIKEEYTVFFVDDGQTYTVRIEDTPSEAVSYAQKLLQEIVEKGAKDPSLWVQMNSKVNQYIKGQYCGTIEYGKVIWVC